MDHRQRHAGALEVALLALSAESNGTETRWASLPTRPHTRKGPLTADGACHGRGAGFLPGRPARYPVSQELVSRKEATTHVAVVVSARKPPGSSMWLLRVVGRVRALIILLHAHVIADAPADEQLAAALDRWRTLLA